jgi:ferritin-like metal-binding protein YciE
MEITMAKAAQSGDLKAAFEKHRTETEGTSRPSKRYSPSSTRSRKPRPAAIVGITDEGAKIMEEYKASGA